MLDIQPFFEDFELWTSPYINRFIQADTIMSGAGNPQSFDRYSYVLNNPVRYIDPSGHVSCSGSNWDDGPQCVSKAEFQTKATKELRKVLSQRYKWHTVGNFVLKELAVIFQTGWDIERYIDGLTGGKGSAWMGQNLGNTYFVHASWGDSHAETWPIGGSTILLGKNWLHDPIWTPRELVSHELGHVWDIHTSFAASATMMSDLGGPVWFLGKPENIPQWDPQIHPVNGDAYGNSARNDYFAEAFSLTVYAPQNTPTGVSSWINNAISNPPLSYYQPWG